MPRINPIGEPFIYLDEVDSSNNYAMRQIQAHLAEHGSVYFAGYQTHGKGQRGKRWQAGRGENIIISCILQPDLLSVDNKFVVSACVALACYDFFKSYAVDNTFVKWPNDIYWKDRKAGGILIENILQGKKWKFAIAGIGININQTLFDPAISNAVSLKQITGKTFDTVFLAKQLCGFLQKRWLMLLHNGLASIMEDYNAVLYKLNMAVTLRQNQVVFNAIIKGVNEKGLLLADTGKTSAIEHGDVEWVI